MYTTHSLAAFQDAFIHTNMWGWLVQLPHSISFTNQASITHLKIARVLLSSMPGWEPLLVPADCFQPLLLASGSAGSSNSSSG
jgi:hypothetical protein